MHSPLQSPLQPVMRSPLEFRRRGGGFNIASTNPSAYYDRTVLATLFQSWTGVLPVTATSQTIGLGLDLSQGATVGSDALSHPLAGAQSGGWSLSGDTIVRSGVGGNSYLDFAAPQDANSIYLVEFDVSGFSGDSFSIQTPQGNVGAISANGHYTFRIRATGSTRMQFISWAGVAAAAVISNISSKVIAGNHQLQATAGKRPILSSRVNLLTQSEDFSNADWIKTDTTPTQVDGAVWRMVPTAVSTAHSFENNVGAVVGTQCWTAEFKADGYSKISMREGVSTGAYVVVNLLDATIVASGNAPTSYTITQLADGWVRISLVKAPAGNFGRKVNMVPDSYTSGDPNGVYFSGDGVSGVLVRYPQCNYGPTATKYQWITTVANYGTVGFPTYADFDQVDDDLVATFPASLGSGCTVCRSLPSTGASITTGVTLTATYTDNVDAHALLIYTSAQWAALDAGQIANITTWLNAKAGL